MGRARVAFGLDLETAIKSADEVLPRDRSGQLDELTLVELVPESVEKFVGNVGGIVGQTLRVLDCGLLEVTELLAVGVAV